MKRNSILTILLFLIFAGLYIFMIFELYDQTKRFTEAAETVDDLSELIISKEEEIANLKNNQLNLEQKIYKNSTGIFVLSLGTLKSINELSEIKNRLDKLENTQSSEGTN